MESDQIFPHLLSDFHLNSSLPLFDLIIKDDLKGVKKLIESESRCLMQFDDDELTPLHLAVEMGKEELVKCLIEAVQLNCGLQDSLQNETSANGFSDIINHRTLDLKMAPLHLSVRNGSLTISDFLLSSGADVNIRNKIDHTPLHVAVTTKNIEMIRLLILWKADINVVTSDQRRESPLLKASTISLEITRLLLDTGATV